MDPLIGNLDQKVPKVFEHLIVGPGLVSPCEDGLLPPCEDLKNGLKRFQYLMFGT